MRQKQDAKYHLREAEQLVTEIENNPNLLLHNKSEYENLLRNLDKNKILFKWVKRNYGERCLEYLEGCACCVAWDLYDRLVQKKPLIPERKRVKKRVNKK